MNARRARRILEKSTSCGIFASSCAAWRNHDGLDGIRGLGLERFFERGSIWCDLPTTVEGTWKKRPARDQIAFRSPILTVGSAIAIRGNLAKPCG